MLATYETKENDKTYLKIVMTPDEVKEELMFVRQEILDAEPGEINYNKFRSLIMERYSAKGFKENNLLPVTRVLFMTKDDLLEGKEYSFQAAFMAKPKFTLSSYDPVKITKRSTDVKMEEVNELIDEIRQEHKSLVLQSPEALVSETSSVEFAIETTQDGEDYSPLWAKRRLYKLGEDFLPKEFDQQLVGMLPNETKEIKFTMQYVPEESTDKEPIETAFVSTVTVYGVYEETLPEMSDAWVASTFMDLRTVDDLYEFARKQLEAEQEVRIDEAQRHQIVSALARRLQEQISDNLFESKFAEFHQTFEEQIKDSGSTIEEYLKEEKVDLGQFKMESMMKLREQLKQAFALDAYADYFALEASPQDYETFFSEINPEAPSLLHQDFEMNGRMYIADEGALRISALRHLAGRALNI